ncbi:hypothetical protein ACHQM5_009312 [Ranunculus cassubicifolius]
MMNTKEKLPHDLVIEILSWLHVKHLWPLRCVSKTWLHLLTKDTQFAKLQYDRFLEINNNYPDPMILASLYHRNDSNLFLATEFTSCDKAISVEYPVYQPTSSYHLCGISNGLLCLFRRDYKEVYIWNPLINDHITISCLPAPSSRFPGYKTYTRFGFGFDQDRNVYKVVRFFNENYDVDDFLCDVLDSWTQISVYTIGVDSMWRIVEVDIELDFSAETLPLVNGFLHWSTDRPGSMSTFDLNEEVRGELLLPHGIKFEEVVELGGFLSATSRRANLELHVWLMKEYGVVSSWCKQYIIVKPEGYITFFQLSTMGLAHTGEVILKEIDGNLVLYNPETNTVRDLERFRFPNFIPYIYLGSIISPTAISRAGENLLEAES